MTDHWQGWEEEPTLRVDPRLRPHLLRLKRRLRALPGWHRLRVRVAKVYLHDPLNVRELSHWRLAVTCDCGFDAWDAVQPCHLHKPGLSFRRLLRVARARIGGMGCREMAALAAVADVLSA